MSSFISSSNLINIIYFVEYLEFLINLQTLTDFMVNNSQNIIFIYIIYKHYTLLIIVYSIFTSFTTSSITEKNSEMFHQAFPCSFSVNQQLFQAPLALQAEFVGPFHSYGLLKHHLSVQNRLNPLQCHSNRSSFQTFSK